MRKITAFVLLLLPLLAYTQSYVPIPLSNCHWIFKMQKTGVFEQQQLPPSYAEFKIYPSGDTTVGSKKYIKLYRQLITATLSPNPYCAFSFPLTGDTIEYYGALRQDTLARKVYNLAANSNELLVYDFNYNTGDSLQTFYGVLNAPMNDPKRSVDSTFYQSYSDGICRKTFRMKPYVVGSSSNGMTFTEYFTEGIGNNNGILCNFKMLKGTDFAEWSNQETWSSQLYINEVPLLLTKQNNCVQDVGMAEQWSQEDIRLFPSPAGSRLCFQLPQDLTSDYSVQIFDLTGREIILSHTNDINVEQLSSGCYLFRLTDAGGTKVYVTRFVKE